MVFILKRGLPSHTLTKTSWTMSFEVSKLLRYLYVNTTLDEKKGAWLNHQ